MKSWVQGSWLALKESAKGDVIFSWYDFQAVVCFFLAKLTFRKRKIVAINVMLKFNNSFKGRLYKWMYKIALSSKDFYATVTSREYGDYLNRMLGINRSYTLIHDAYLDKYKADNETVKETVAVVPNTVFMGGNSSRDWDFAMQLAETMEDVTFNFVMSESAYNGYKDRIKPNMNVRYNIPLQDFNNLMRESCLVMMPVSTEAPAGLIVMFTASTYEKMYITNRTATSSEYITDERGCILPKELDVWAENIRYYLAHMDEAAEKAVNFRAWVERECGTEKFVEGMKSICEEIRSDG